MSKFTSLTTETESKLFKSNSFVVEYCVIEEELQGLFNLCLSLQNGIQGKILTLINECKDLEKNPNQIYDSFDGMEFENRDAINGIEEFQIPSWKSLSNFMVPMNQVILISIFIEKSLKSLCSEYAPQNTSPYYGAYTLNLKQQKGKSKVESYLDYLADCGLHVDTPKDLTYLNNHIRRIRNSFVHGDWNDCYKSLTNMDINSLFIAATDLMNAIEIAFITKNASANTK